MSKSLEDLVKARLKDPRAMRGAVQFVKGKPRIVLGVVGDHPRVAVEFDGDNVSIVEPTQEASKAPEKSANAGDVGQSGGKAGQKKN